MNKIPENTVIRDRKRSERLPNGSACMVCGFSDRRALESHHVAGRKNDETLTVVVCRNHHGVVTEELRVSGVSMAEAANPVVRLAAILAGIAELFRMLTAALIGWADWLTRLAELLDRELPEWEALALRLPNPDSMRDAS